MKKTIGILLGLMMLLGCLTGLADDYTLPEKMENQMKVGSGLKGSFTMHMEGTDPVILSMSLFQDTEIQIRAIRSGSDLHIALFREEEDESQKGLTEILNQDGGWYLRSDMLPDLVLRLPDSIQTANLLHQPAGENPSFATALTRWFEMSENKRSSLLDPVTEKLSRKLEVWLAQFAGVSEVQTTESGASVVDLSYTIPMGELRKEIVSLLEELIQDPDGQALLNAILSPEQMEIYASGELDYFYIEALEALDNDYDVLYTRRVTTLGQMISSSMEFPLDEEKTGYRLLTIEDNGGLMAITLRGEDSMASALIPGNIDFSKIDSFNAWIMYRPEQTEKADASDAMALRLTVSHSSELSSDEESREHLKEHWNAQAVWDVSRLPEGEDPADYPETAPMELDLDLHYASKASQSSPTSLTVEGLMTKENFSLAVKGEVKTSAPWILKPFETEAAEDLANMTADEQTLLLAEWLSAVGEDLATGAGNPSVPEVTAESLEKETEEPQEKTMSEPSEETEEKTDEPVEEHSEEEAETTQAETVEEHSEEKTETTQAETVEEPSEEAEATQAETVEEASEEAEATQAETVEETSEEAEVTQAETAKEPSEETEATQTETTEEPLEEDPEEIQTETTEESSEEAEATQTETAEEPSEGSEETTEETAAEPSQAESEATQEETAEEPSEAAAEGIQEESPASKE